MSADGRFDSTTTTTCGYCGVGCRLEAHARGGRIVSISPAEDGPANRGHTCLKGRFAHQYTRSRDRLTAPLIRESGAFRMAPGTRRSSASRASSCASGRARPRRDRRPGLLAGDERGLLRDAACVFAPPSAHTTSTTARASATPLRPSRCASPRPVRRTGSFDDIEAARAPDHRREPRRATRSPAPASSRRRSRGRSSSPPIPAASSSPTTASSTLGCGRARTPRS